MIRARSYAPSPALSRIVARHYVFSVTLPGDYVLDDKVLAETSFIRIPMLGDWHVEVRPGEWTPAGFAAFFGPNAAPMAVRCVGSFIVAGIAFRPGGWRACFDHSTDHYTDRMLPLDAMWGDDAGSLTDAVTLADTVPDDVIVARMEQVLLTRIGRRGAIVIDDVIEQFEDIARNNSVIQVSEAAAALGLSQRQLERRCVAAFGMTPKTVLRRSRFLDKASALRGLSQPSDEELAALRYYDQSHLNREFHRWIGMTPGQFAVTPTPLLTAGLELRTMRQAEDARLVQAAHQAAHQSAHQADTARQAVRPAPVTA